MMIDICTNFHENILDNIKVTEWTRFLHKKFKGDIILQKLWMELWFLFSAHHLMVVYICTKLHENILNCISYEADAKS